jgi:hypothetical protein
VAWQEQQAALHRLEVAKKAGALQRGRQRLDGGLLQLSTDVRAARGERAASTTIAGAQAKSREAWLEYRTNQERAKSKEKMLSGPVLVPSRDAVPKAKVKSASTVVLDRDSDGLER